MKKQYYKLSEIKNNKNLLPDLKLDIIFKKVILHPKPRNYLCLLISKIYNINFKDLISNIKIINGEIPNKNLEIKSSYTDIVINYKNKVDIIIEMNNYERTIHKNNYYMLSMHINKANNLNNYAENLYTYLLNIDSYDVLNKNNLLYSSKLLFYKYKISKYNNIKSTHINLAYLENKYYNNSKLNELELLLLPFVEQRKDVLLNILKIKEGRELINIMEEIKYTKLPTYDVEAFQKLMKERFEEDVRRLRIKEKKFKIKERDFKDKEKDFKDKEKDFKDKEKDFKDKEKDFKDKEKDLKYKEKNLKEKHKTLLKKEKEINDLIKKYKKFGYLKEEDGKYNIN